MNPAKAAPSAPVKKAARFASDFKVRNPARSAKVFWGIKKRRIVQNDAAKTKVSSVDIPTGWDPRTKQQPTGLVACPASPMDFSDCKYDHQAFDFQDEAIWDVIWLADK